MISVLRSKAKFWKTSPGLWSDSLQVEEQRLLFRDPSDLCAPGLIQEQGREFFEEEKLAQKFLGFLLRLNLSHQQPEIALA